MASETRCEIQEDIRFIRHAALLKRLLKMWRPQYLPSSARFQRLDPKLYPPLFANVNLLSFPDESNK